MIKINDILEKTLQNMQNAANSPYGFGGIPTGLCDLDKALYGFENSDLIVVGARPAMGKTGFLITLALNMAKLDIPVMFYSLEMSNTQIANRIITNETGIDGHRIRTGRMNDKEWDVLNRTIENIATYPIFLTDKNNWEIEVFCDKVKNDIENTNAKIIFIDYLQLFSTREKYQNRYEEIALCTRELKKLAKELDIPIIVASQLNRNVENRPSGVYVDKKPQMFDLRDSGTICDDANVVLLLHRPEYYLRSYEDAEGNDINGLAEVIITKNHMGYEDTIKLRFKPEFARFEDWMNVDNSERLLDLYKNSDTIESPF